MHLTTITYISLIQIFYYLLRAYIYIVAQILIHHGKTLDFKRSLLYFGKHRCTVLLRVCIGCLVSF